MVNLLLAGISHRDLPKTHCRGPAVVYSPDLSEDRFVYSEKRGQAKNGRCNYHFGSYQNVFQYALSNSNGSTDDSKS